MQLSGEELIKILPEISGSYRVNADLSKINWFNVGGLADVMFRPKNVEDLAYFLKNKPIDIPVVILGVGSNLLVRDGGIAGVVIRLGRGFAAVEKSCDYIRAGAGCLSFNAATFSAHNNCGGLEFLSGIPGTIGGALAMNAGAYGNDVASVLHTAEAVDEGGNIHQLSVDDIGYIYRGNTLPDGMIFTSALFKCAQEDRAVVEGRINEITSKRESTQPIKERTSGSTFKNPEGHKAWQLIDAAGCRGLEIGGAKVSEKHCNFFINTGKSTASDIENLGEEVRQKVLKKSGIKLQWEVQIIGRTK